MNTDLKTVRSRLKKTMLVLPYQVGVVMVAWSKDRFKYQEWTDSYPEKWPARSTKKAWTKKGRNNKGRALLVKTGRLRRSIRIMNTTANSVTIGSDVPYAAAHNEGLRMKFVQNVKAYNRKVGSGSQRVRAHRRSFDYKMPRRRFIGESKNLNTRIVRTITAALNKIWL